MIRRVERGAFMNRREHDVNFRISQIETKKNIYQIRFEF